MSEIPPSNSEKSSEPAMTAEAVRDEMKGHIGSIVALVPEGSRKTALSYASRVLGLPFGRVRSLYYGEARRIDAHEADRVRAYVHAAHKLIEARAQYESLRRSYFDEVKAHPALSRSAPGPLVDDEVSREAQAVVDKVAPLRRRRA